jgi:hypothetical protein
MTLLIFHLVLSSYTFDGVDVGMAQKVLDWNLKRYPEGTHSPRILAEQDKVSANSITVPSATQGVKETSKTTVADDLTNKPERLRKSAHKGACFLLFKLSFGLE